MFLTIMKEKYKMKQKKFKSIKIDVFFYQNYNIFTCLLLKNSFQIRKNINFSFNLKSFNDSKKNNNKNMRKCFII